MDTQTTESLTKLAISLSGLIVKSTASSVTTKIKAMKNENDITKLRNNYEEIINGLISEREEAVRIAQAYRSEIGKIEISDEDIEHLHNTVTRIFDILKTTTSDVPVDTLEPFQELINVDTLKTMQLIGFNYKAAIGEPLTEWCANLILSNIKSKNGIKSLHKK
jgi:hypothetical protein